MPEYLRPGVFIEEIERGPRPIEGVPTSTAAFLGAAERGPIKPRMVTSYKEYTRYFGGIFGNDNFLPYAASGFFENGGKRLFVCRHRRRERDGRAGRKSATSSCARRARAAGARACGRTWVRSTTLDRDRNPVGFRVASRTSREGDEIFDPFDPANASKPQPYFEDFDDLVTDERSPDYYGKRLNFVDIAKGTRTRGRMPRR